MSNPVDMDREFQAQHDMRTLEEAEKIKNSPERLTNIKKVAESNLQRSQEIIKDPTPNEVAEEMLSKGFVKLPTPERSE